MDHRVRQDAKPSRQDAGAPPNTGSLAYSDRITGILPVMEDSASSLSAHETTGWKPILLLNCQYWALLRGDVAAIFSNLLEFVVGLAQFRCDP